MCRGRYGAPRGGGREGQRAGRCITFVGGHSPKCDSHTLPPPHTMTRQRNRLVVVDWLVDIASVYRLSVRTVELTMRLFDAAATHADASKLLVQSAACLLLASKLEGESLTPTMLIQLSGCFTHAELLESEWQIMTDTLSLAGKPLVYDDMLAAAPAACKTYPHRLLRCCVSALDLDDERFAALARTGEDVKHILKQYAAAQHDMITREPASFPHLAAVFEDRPTHKRKKVARDAEADVGAV